MALFEDNESKRANTRKCDADGKTWLFTRVAFAHLRDLAFIISRIRGHAIINIDTRESRRNMNSRIRDTGTSGEEIDSKESEASYLVQSSRKSCVAYDIT